MTGIPPLAIGRAKRLKYGNIRCELDGYSFDSKRERDYYCELKIRERAREITDIRVHPKYPIEINGIKVCDVVMDFVYMDLVTRRVHAVDVKGRDNAMSKLKRKLFEVFTRTAVEIVK